MPRPQFALNSCMLLFFFSLESLDANRNPSLYFPRCGLNSLTSLQNTNDIRHDACLRASLDQRLPSYRSTTIFEFITVSIDS